MDFMDAYLGYDQIIMHLKDEKIFFITKEGTFCNTWMPFGLKNAKMMYQCLVSRMFKGQLGRNTEVHVDNMTTKSIKNEEHICDLEKTFEILRHYNMKRNLK